MSYQVIARKWRPQTFEEVTGQEHITRTLRGAIEHDRLHHAYLFSGARGVGKTTTARLLAKAVNCHKAAGPTPTPCSFNDPEACPSCREIAEGRSIDVLEIDAASNTGVDNVRDAIISNVGVRPARDRYKVFIIDEVHMLSGAAFNALLKTLEEPPPRVLFIMATTEAHKVPDTILSRCQQFEFRTISPAKIFERLKLIADSEGVRIKDDALREIARAGEGSMRDAQSAFDQVISFSEGEIETRDVETALGIAGVELRARVMRAVAEAAPADALAVVDDLVSRGHDLRNFCRDLLAHVRDLLVVKVAGEGSALADAGEAERKELMKDAETLSESDLVRFFHSLTETEKNLRESAHPRYQLEIGLVKLIEMRRLAPLGRILERLAALEESVHAGGAHAAAETGTPPASTPAAGGGGGSRRGSAGGVGGSSASAFSAAAREEEETSPAAHASSPSTHTRVDGEVSVLDLTASQTAGSDAPVRAPGAEGGDADAPTAPPFAGLKLVPPNASETGAQTAPAYIDDEAPFPVEGAVRAPTSAAGAARAQSSSRQTPPPAFETRAPQAAGAGPQTFAGAAAPARSATDDEGAWPPAEPPDGYDDGPLGRVKRALEARRKPFLAVALEEARTARLGDDELFVAFTPDKKFLRDTLAKPDNVRILQETCREVLGRNIGIHVVVREAGESDEMPLTPEDEQRLERQRLREWAEQQPAVQQVMRDLRAEIVDVRRVDAETK